MMGPGRLIAAAVVVVAIVGASPALACSPLAPPYPPAAPEGTSPTDAEALAEAWKQAHWQRADEEQRARRMKEQTRLFDEAASVAVVRYDRQAKASEMPAELAHMNGGPLTILKPVRLLKGDGAPEELSVSRGFAPQCGWVPANDALNGKPGDVFLFYMSANGHVLDGFKVESIIEPRALELLTKGY